MNHQLNIGNTDPGMKLTNLRSSIQINVRLKNHHNFLSATGVKVERIIFKYQ
jgi:hypothetical protein